MLSGQDHQIFRSTKQQFWNKNFIAKSTQGMGIRNEKIKNNQNSKGVGKNKIQRNDLPIFTSREMATGQKIFHASGPISPASIKKSNSGPALD